MAENPFAQFAAPAAPGENPFAQFVAPPAAPAEPPAVNRSPVTGRPVAPLDLSTTTTMDPSMPWYAQAGQAADDIVRLIANGATFGYADKAAGYLSGDGTEAERAATQAARDRAGSAGTVAEVGGAAAVPIGAGNAGLTGAGRFGSGAAKGLGGLAARTGLMGAEGAGYGALTAAGNDQDISDGALLGAIFGAGGNIASEGVTKALGWLASNIGRPAVPTMADVTAARDAAYQAADNAGVVYTPQATGNLWQRLQNELGDFGYDPRNQPGGAPALDRISELATSGQNVSLKGLDTLRKVANHGYDNGTPLMPANKSNNVVVSKVVNAIDDLINQPAAGDVLTGDAAGGAKAMADARDMARRAIKASEVEDKVKFAESRAASTGKGGNIDNATRQNMRHILDRGARGYTPDEVAALEQIVFGSPTQNFLRWAGGFSPQNTLGGGMGATAGASTGAALGGFFGGPAGAATGATIGALGVPAFGFAAKKAADSMTRGNVDDLIEVIMNGGRNLPMNAAQQTIQNAAPDLARILYSYGNNEAAR